MPDPVLFNQRKTFFLGAEEMLVRRQLSSCPYAAHLIKSFLHDALQGSKKWNVYKAGKMICAHEELGYLTVRLGKDRGNKKKVTKASSLRLSHLGFAHKDKRHILMCFSGGSDGKEYACSAGDPGLIPGSGRSPGEGNGKPLQCSCLENSMDTGAWWATVHGVVRSRTQLND